MPSSLLTSGNFKLPAANRVWLRVATLLLLLAGLAVPRAWANYGFIQTYAILNANASSNQYLAGSYNPDNAPAFNGQQLGTFSTSSSLTLGGEVRSYKNGTDNVQGAKIYYQVYRTGKTGNGFSPLSLYFSNEFANGGDTDQRWTDVNNTQGQNLDVPINLLKGLTVSGNYTVEVYWTVDITGNSQYDSNFQNNFKATFDFTAGPLPVSLTAFTAVRQGSAALLGWTTASEHDNAGYDVQVSASGADVDFQTLAFVPAPTAESQVARTYTYLDQTPGLLGQRYYRLRQLDLSGEATYSAVRVVQFGAPVALSLTAAPNPFGSSLALSLALPEAVPTATLTLTDALGRSLLRQDLGPLPAGASQPALSAAGLAALPPGLYVVRLALPGSTQALKVVKQ